MASQWHCLGTLAIKRPAIRRGLYWAGANNNSPPELRSGRNPAKVHIQ